MRVGVVCPYDMGAYGGVQSLVLDLVSRLTKSGEDAFLIAPGECDSEGFVSVGGTTHVPGNGSRSPVALSPMARRRTLQAVAHADVLHVHEPLMPQVSIAALAAHKPTVATFHADIAPWTEKTYRVFQHLGARLLGSAHLTAVSPVAASGLPPSWQPVTIVPNALEVAEFAVDVPRLPNRVVFVGRDDPRKGLDVLLNAWPQVRQRCNGAELHVIGALRESAPGITWHGRVDDAAKREILASSSVYVAPNLGGESFGIILAEAMAAGCAVVASDLPAFQAVAGEAAILVPRSDAVGLADAVAELLTSQRSRLDLAARGRARVQRFDWGVVLDQYRSLYDAALSIQN